MITKRRNSKLNRAYAYWRLAAKASKNGNYRAADRYTDMANRLHAEYLREKEYTAKREAAAKLWREKISKGQS